MINFKAILFDFDGTIADTMTDNFFAWKEAFKKYEVHLKKEDYFPLEGLKVIDIAKTIGSKFKIEEKEFEKLVNLKKEYYLKNNKFLLYAGVEELIDLLNEMNIPLAIVSASPREKIEKTTQEKFLEKFNLIISEEDYEKGKPYPDPYLTAAKKLEIPIRECLVVENSPFGIKAAKSAGAYCVAVTSTLDERCLSEADEIIENISDLKKLIAS